MDYEIYSYTEQPTEECIGVLIHSCSDAGEANAFFDASEEIAVNGGCIIEIERRIIRLQTLKYDEREFSAVGPMVTVLGG